MVFYLAVQFNFTIYQNYKKQVLIILISITSFYLIYSGPITNAVAKKNENSINEMMSIPTMQLSRAMVKGSSDLTEEEKRLIEKYVPSYEVYESLEGISDSIKNSFNRDAFKENPSEFISLWLRVGLKQPLTYIEAFSRITIGLWYTDMNYKDSKAYHDYWDYVSTGVNSNSDVRNVFLILDQKALPGFAWLDKFYKNISSNNMYQKIPIISILFSSGIVIWGVWFYLATIIYYKNYKYLFVIIFPILLVFTLFLGPVVLYRYIYPIVMIQPLLLASICSVKIPQKQELEKDSDN